VRSLVNSLRANTPREEWKPARTCLIVFALTSGSARGLAL
jgi:hypothetical protein